MTRVRNYIFVRHRHNWRLLLRFGLVGASGVVVNLLTVVLVKKLGPDADGAAMGLLGTEYNVRWYHVYSTLAFLTANLWNYQLNRRWTFASEGHAGWWREYGPFLAVGLLGQALGLAMLTLLMHPGSALSLPQDLLDDSTGLRTRLYWAQLIVIGVVTPVAFVLNKVWTFAAVRHHGHSPQEDDVVPAAAVDEVAAPGDGEAAGAGAGPVASRPRQ